MTLGQGQLGGDVSEEEDSGDVHGYGFMEVDGDHTDGASFPRLLASVFDTSSTGGAGADNGQ